MNRMVVVMLGFGLLLGLTQVGRAQPATQPAEDGVIRVAIYEDSGGSAKGCVNVENCLGKSAKFTFKRVTAESIRDGALKDFDVLVQPGGGGSKQAKTLEATGREQIRQFVNNGGGYVGICAGAYLATTEYAWSLGILNAKVIDRAHWARGSGIVKLRFSEEGRKVLDIDQELHDCDYNQGPLLAPGDSSEVAPYTELASFETEIAKNGAPEGVMKGTTAIAIGTYGKGKVAAISPHPERSAGLDGLIRRIVEHVHADEPAVAEQQK